MNDKRTNLCLHLVSDSTGWTVMSAAKSALEHFPLVDVSEFVWSFVNDKENIDKVMSFISKSREKNFVIYTLSDDFIRNYLKLNCKSLSVPCVPVLAEVIKGLSSYLNIEKKSFHSGESEFSPDYLSRVDAINYAVSHDDGQGYWNLEDADIIIVGASRTSKSPTSVYMAYHGYKVANIPFVSDLSLPIDFKSLENTLIVGLVIDVDRLRQIRSSRLLATDGLDNINYVNRERIEEEIQESLMLFRSNGWPIIDVTKKSIEEVSAIMIQLYKRKRGVNA